MDAKLNGEQTPSGGFPLWDLFVDTATMIVAIITGAEEDQQQANVAATLTLGSIPQVPAAGVDWLGFLAGSTAFSAIDSQIRDMMRKGGHPDFYPAYDLLNGDILSVVAAKNTAVV